MSTRDVKQERIFLRGSCDRSMHILFEKHIHYSSCNTGELERKSVASFKSRQFHLLLIALQKSHVPELEKLCFA